jgi:hypothetical protein
MKALSLWQPWATLIAIGEKRFETRDWRTSYRGPLLIHAARAWNTEIRAACADGAIGDALERGRHSRTGLGLPLGAIVATCRLVACHRMPEYGEDWSDLERRGLRGDELLFGDFSPGRYAWELADVCRLPQPIPAKGAQGLWEWAPPPGFPLRPGA